jgi:hypothetical protein
MSQDPHGKQPDEQEKASGTVAQPIQPGEVQPGDENERASNLGGPVDIFPARPGKPPQQQD